MDKDLATDIHDLFSISFVKLLINISAFKEMVLSLYAKFIMSIEIQIHWK